MFEREYIVAIDKDTMHGTPCFAGTRVPVQTLIDFLETGESIHDFLKVYPYIRGQQVHAFLELSKGLVIEQLSLRVFLGRLSRPAALRLRLPTAPV